MEKSELSSLTVAELKDKLKSKGLPLSGNKSELISRLNDNSDDKKPLKSKGIPLDSKSNQDKPFFQYISENGIKNLDIDRWEVGKYALGFFMVVFMLISLSSTSWYSVKYVDESQEDFFGDEVDIKESYEFKYGLSGIEFESEMSFGMDSMSESIEIDYDHPLCNDDDDELQCGKMELASNFIKIFFWLSILTTATLLGLSIAKGFGKVDSTIFDVDYDKIQKWGWHSTVLIPLSALLIYAIIAFTYDIGDLFGGEGTSGLGSTWWLMFLLNLGLAAVVYNEKTTQFIEFVKEKLQQK
ncbi:MAG: hypothetical protein CMB20_005370 [Methanobacteriota archaeon]|nr:MAG: hypothetical protein CMB20_005370 [Euryarchaeota archaeon]